MSRIEGHAVYALSDPTSGAVRYIGYSKDVHARYKGHLCENSPTHKSRWVNKLLREGLTPRLMALCLVQDAAEAKRVEVALISLYKRRGARLTNGNAGGDGMVNPSAEVRAKIGAAGRGRVPSAETREKISAAHTGMVRPAGTGSKISSALTGRKLSKEHCEKIRAAKRNISAATRAKLRAARKGKKRTAEARAKTSAALRGMSPERRAEWCAKLSAAQSERSPSSAETRAKISASLKGRVVTSESRAKMSAAHKGKKLSPESIAKRTATNKVIGRIWTAEQKARAAEAARAAWSRDPGRRAKQSALMTEVHSGRTLSTEHKKKIGAALRGKRQSETARANMKAARVKRRGVK